MHRLFWRQTEPLFFCPPGRPQTSWKIGQALGSPLPHPVSSSEGIRNNGLEDLTLEFSFTCTLYILSISCLSHHFPIAQKNLKLSLRVAMKGDSHFHSSGRREKKSKESRGAPRRLSPWSHIRDKDLRLASRG